MFTAWVGRLRADLNHTVVSACERDFSLHQHVSGTQDERVSILTAGSTSIALGLRFSRAMDIPPLDAYEAVRDEHLTLEPLLQRKHNHIPTRVTLFFTYAFIVIFQCM